MKKISILFIIPLIFFFLITPALAWTAPISDPPDDSEVKAPINVSSVDQIKTGGLIINGILRAFDRLLVGGLSTDTVSPNLLLDVEGNVGAQKYCDNTGDLASCKTISQMGGGASTTAVNTWTALNTFKTNSAVGFLVQRSLDNVPAFWVDSADLNLDLFGKIEQYNAIITEGMGVPPIVDSVVLTGQNTAIGSTLLTGTETPGIYRINTYLNVTTLGSPAITITGTYDFTDDAGTTAHGAISATTVAKTRSRATGIYQSAGTAGIYYRTTLSGAIGAAVYSLYIVVEKLS
jgi:hypothetical protein